MLDIINFQTTKDTERRILKLPAHTDKCPALKKSRCTHSYVSSIPKDLNAQMWDNILTLLLGRPNLFNMLKSSSVENCLSRFGYFIIYSVLTLNSYHLLGCFRNQKFPVFNTSFWDRSDRNLWSEISDFGKSDFEEIGKSQNLFFDMNPNSSDSDSDDEFELKTRSNTTSILLIVITILVMLFSSGAEPRPQQLYDPSLRILRTSAISSNLAYLETRYNFEINYRMTRPELVTLADYLLPGIRRRTTDRIRYNNVEGLAIVIRRLAFPARWSDLSREFGRHPTVICRIYDAVMEVWSFIIIDVL
jgi:hypothetical protein